MIGKSIIRRIGAGLISATIIMTQLTMPIAADEILVIDEGTVGSTDETVLDSITGEMNEAGLQKVEDLELNVLDEELNGVDEEITDETILCEGEGIFAGASQIGNMTFGPGINHYKQITNINTNSTTSVVPENTGADPHRPALGPERLYIGKAYFQYNYNPLPSSDYPSDTYNISSSLYYYFEAPSDGEYTISMKAKNTYQLLLENIGVLGDGASTNPFGKLTGNEELKQITVGLRKGLYLICAYSDNKAAYEDQIFIRVDKKEVNSEADLKWIEMEPNDYYNAAMPIPLNTLVTGSRYIGQSDKSGDKDYYKFDVAQRGIITLSDTSNFNEIIVSDPSKNSIVIYNKYSKYSKSIGVGPGTHYIKVSGISDETNYDNTKYTFKIAFTPTDSAEIEPNNRYGIATPIEMNKTYWASPVSSYDNDYFKFTLPSSKKGLKINFSIDMKGAQIDVKKEDGSIYFSTMNGKSFTVDKELEAGEYYVIFKLFDDSKITEDNNSFTFCIGGEVTDIQINPTPSPTPSPTPVPEETPSPTPYPNKEENPETNDGWGDIDDEDKYVIDPTVIKEDTINITGVHDAVYTGSPITFDLRVYKGTNLLKEGTDYSVKYVNNKLAWEGQDNNAGDILDKQPAIVIRGNGVYKDIIDKYVRENGEKLKFKIKRISLENDMEVTASNDAVIFQKNKRYKPIPKVTYKGRKLINNKDYVITYLDKNNNKISEYMEPGIYIVDIKGKGNYSGNIKSTYTIVEQDEAVLISKAVITGIKKSIPYTGTEIKLNNLKTPSFRFKAKINKVDTDLVEDVDYTVRYVNNVEAGLATIIFTAKEGNSKNLVGEKYLTFKIAGTPLSKTKIVFKVNKSDVKETKMYDYTGKQVKPLVVVNTKGTNSVTLNEGEDYTVEYRRNINAGTALVYVRGIGAYEGSVKKSFKIKPVNLGSEATIKAELDGKSFKIENTGKYGIKVKVTFGGRLLTEGKDYTMSYKNNLKAGSADAGKNAPQVIIKGKGNFTKSISPIPFNITE